MRRPRLNLTLILSALAIASGVLALSGPVNTAVAPEPRHAILVMDTGSRMLTRHPDNLTSFDHARSQAQKLLDELEPEDRVHLVCRQPQGIQALELPRDKARTALGKLVAGVSPGGLRDVLARAEEIDATHADTEIVVYSDRAVKGFRTCRTGVEKTGNVGIVDLSVTPEAVFVRFVNAGPERAVRLEISGTKMTRTLPHGDSSILVERASKEPVDVRILDRDNLPADDRGRSTTLPGRGTLKVSYRGRKSEDLLRILTALPDVSIEETLGPVDVIVVYRGKPGPRTPQALVVIAPDGTRSIPPFELADPVHPVELALDEKHPVTREILYATGEITLGKVVPSTITTASEAAALISAAGKPICSIAEEEDRLTFLMAFDPCDPRCGWSKKPTFVVMMAALFEHIRRTLGGEREQVLRAGEPVDLSGQPGLRHLDGGATLHGAVLQAARPGTETLRSDLGRFEAHFCLLDASSSQNMGEWAPIEERIFSPDRERIRHATPLSWFLTLLCLVFAVGAYTMERFSRA
jgi:hypothetical protein